MTVDTLSLAKELRAAELSSTQAEAIAAAIGRAVLEGAATKMDVQSLRGDLLQDTQSLRSDLTQDIQALRSDLTQDIQVLRSDLTQDIQALRSDVTQDIQALRSDLTQDIQARRSELLQVEAKLETKIEHLRSTLMVWFIGTVLTLAAIIVAAAKL